MKLFVIECAESFDNCFCVSMGTNRVDSYDVFVRAAEGGFLCDVRGAFKSLFEKFGSPAKMVPRFIEENKTKVAVPESATAEETSASTQQISAGMQMVKAGEQDNFNKTNSLAELAKDVYRDIIFLLHFHILLGEYGRGQ